MTDVDAATAYLGSLPIPAPPVAQALRMSTYSPAELRDAVQSLAARGYIGCLPFAHDEEDDIVVRLLPGQHPRDCRIGVVFAASAITIAPSLEHFVAGRLAHSDISQRPVDDAVRHMILDYAASLGSDASARDVLDARVRSTLPEVRCGKLWDAVRLVDPLFDVLADAWASKKAELGSVIKVLESVHGTDNAYQINVFDCLVVGRFRHQRLHNDLIEVEEERAVEPAWRIVMGDHGFDLGYTGVSPGPGFGSYPMHALDAAVNLLWELPFRDKREQSPLWGAAQAAIKNPDYGGEAHLDAARAIAVDDAAGAYTAVANAALYAARSNQALLPQALGFALELATASKWHELAATLQLAQGSASMA